jgi:hypothetical protein
MFCYAARLHFVAGPSAECRRDCASGAGDAQRGIGAGRNRYCAEFSPLPCSGREREQGGLNSPPARSAYPLPRM